MKEFRVKLSSFDEVKQFVALTTKHSYPIHVISDDKLTNAKSLIGFFSMDLSQPVVVRVEDEQADVASFLEDIRGYLV